MSIIDDVRKTNQTTFYAAVGVLDLAVEEVRDAQVRAAKVRAELAPTQLPSRVAAIPGKTIDAVVTFANAAGDTYEDLALRGEKLVERIRNQKATKDLVAQAETTVAAGKGAVTSARKAVAEVERSAKATITTTRKEAARVADVIADSVADEAKVVATEVEQSAKRTRTAAKRTSTTTKNAAKKTTARTKAASTSASKTVKAAPKAAEKAAEKVGD
jgi:heparin binding hemagglutinin HbhA